MDNIAEEQQREVETKGEADQEAGGLALQAEGRQPRQHDDIFSDDTITTTTTSAAAGRSGFSSEHYGGTESTHVVEGGQLISYEYYEVKNEGVDFLDPKTSPGHVILDVATKRFGFQTTGGELVEQTAAFTSPDTPINIIGTSEPAAGRYQQFEYFTKESHDQVLQQKETYFETVYENPEISELYCPKCKVHIHIVLIPNRSDDELRCPTCSEFLRPIGEFSSESSELKNESGGVDVTEEERIEIQLTSGEINIEDEDKTKNMISSTPVVDPPPSKNLLLEKIATDTSITVITEKEERGGFNLTKEREVLEETDLNPETHGDKKPKIFEFCPKCRVCIDKILIRCRDNELRCPSCFGFLKPIGRGWFFQKPVPAVDPGNKKPIEPEPEDIVHPLKPQKLMTRPRNLDQQHGAIKLEILKSIVYGGLIESITSLSVVSSAASAAAATLNIVALALANLIGGLFVIGHNLLELKNDQSRVTSDETDDEQEAVGRYQEVLGQKMNFILHASVAVLSFLVFGLVPPVVYGFSFYKSDERSFKMAAVAAASLACITVLANAKAYVQRPPNWYIYVTTVLHYVVLGVGAAGISYLAGFLLNKLIQKLGWFE
ncbi:membrane protein of ER body 2-like [Juglans microcarpa x Juglans regia]|uniref:membrane protein of ER body 2-like n=1 Tax=Juglans microcarpa x Juglans regia TaxID=2249226 RepID=UPI001B7EFCC2|nr:membrane protein of ER body 2-like [Juglans microcarpa x Juglans regia]